MKWKRYEIVYFYLCGIWKEKLIKWLFCRHEMKVSTNERIFSCMRKNKKQLYNNGGKTFSLTNFLK
jgi:hypothetical protein